MPPLRPPRRLPPSRARRGRGASAPWVPALALVLCVAAAAAAPPAAGHWQRPLAGRVTRGFDYGGDPFAAGRHRGVDFAARPGAPVRSACSGRVVFAGTAGSNGPTVSVRCGAWRVAYLPLRALAVHRGARVGRGTVLGTAAPSGRHSGVHVGVRREGARQDYVDPLRFLGSSGQPPLAPLRRVPRSRRTAPRPPPIRVHPVTVPAVRPEGRPVAAPERPPAAPPVRPLAPWPAWAGLALVLVGASGVGLARWRRGPRPRPGFAVAQGVQSDGG